MRTLILNSGGIDSTLLLKMYSKPKKDRTSLFFDYGQYSAIPESTLALRNAEMLGIEHIYVKIPFSWGLQKPEERNAYFPYRNLIFFANALSIAEAGGYDRIVFGAIKCPDGDYYKDASPEFISWIREEASRSKIIIDSPLIELTKEQVFDAAKHYKIDFQDTWSCDSPVIEAGYKFTRCGKCNDCIHFKWAIENMGLNTPLVTFAE